MKLGTKLALIRLSCCCIDRVVSDGSMIENFNSRLRPYLDERKFMSKKSLGLIQFYLNHKPFMRSKHERLKGKTPAEALTGKAHKPWLEMLGFTPWYKQAS